MCRHLLAVGVLLMAAGALGALQGCMGVQSTTLVETATWTHPTRYTDGSALPLNQIARTTLTWSSSPGGPVVSRLEVAAPAATHVFSCGLPATGVCCITAATTDVAGNTSGPSGEACKTVAVFLDP